MAGEARKGRLEGKNAIVTGAAGYADNTKKREKDKRIVMMMSCRWQIGENVIIDCSIDLFLYDVYRYASA